MKLSLYKETGLEEWIYNIYKKHGIHQPSDLQLNVIADLFNCEIVVWSGPTKAIWDDEFGTIFINNDLSEDAKRKAFFHELGHTFLHVGNQLDMTLEFNNYQEEQVGHFQLYASMPMYMIKQYDLPRAETEFVTLLSTEFKVSRELSTERCDQIRRRIYQASYDQQFMIKLKNQYRTYDPLDSSHWSDETKRIMSQLSRQLAAKEAIV